MILILRSLEVLGGMTQVFLKCIAELRYRRPSIKDILDQTYEVGISSLPLIVVMGFSSGMVMTLQFGLGLEPFGGKPYVPKVMALSVFLELAPVFTALMGAARMGAGMASEIGSMTVTQQIDAMRALGTSPYQKIILPRIIACLLSFPILTLLTCVLALTSTAIIGVTELGLDLLFITQKFYSSITLWEFLSGFLKSFGFALCVALPACYFGLNVKDGTRGVGRATTMAVVTACVLIFISDYFMTKFYWVIYPYGSQ